MYLYESIKYFFPIYRKGCSCQKNEEQKAEKIVLFALKCKKAKKRGSVFIEAENFIYAKAYFLYS
jgi:hypothetical protein